MKKNDREMTGVLYKGVQGFWVRKNIFLTTCILFLLRTIPVIVKLLLCPKSDIFVLFAFRKYYFILVTLPSFKPKFIKEV